MKVLKKNILKIVSVSFTFNKPYTTLFFIFFLFFSQTAFLFAKEILVYGERGCVFCKDFKMNLENSAIKFTYYELSDDKSKTEEMRNHARAAYPNIGNIHLPVVVYDSKVFIRPNFYDFIRRLNYPSQYKTFSERNKIIIYSVMESPETSRLIDNFRARQMKYELKNIAEKEMEEEMRSKLNKKKLEFNYQFPVVEVKDNIFQGATFKDLVKVIK